MNWARRITVRGSQGDRYIVAVSEEGRWGCSCPAWRFKRADAGGRRPDCKHILAVQENVAPRVSERFAELDLSQRTAKTAAALEVGTRFSGLTFEMEVGHA